MSSGYFFSLVVSFTLGVAFESIFNFGYSFAVFIIVLSLFVFLMPSVRLRSRSVLLVSLVLLGFGIGILRIDVFQNNQERYFLDSSLGKTIQIEGIVVEEPDVREEYTNIVLESAVSRLVGEAGVLDEKTKILARIPVYPEFAYGDELSLFGKITVPKNFNSEDGARPFDYRSYLAKDGIYYQMYFPKVSVVSHNKGNAVREKLFTLKRWFMENIADGIAEPEASLASGITLGAKQSLGDDLIQKFRETGVAHIVVLSGYNIAVVAGIFSRVVMFMPFSLRLIVSALGIVLFAMMVGGGATVVRATAMALVVILARMLGREGDALRVLVLVGGLMVFVNPMILLHDVSFQLSFSATLAIVTLVPIFEKYFLFIKNFMLREIVVTTFATQVFVLPLILYHMGSVSLVGFVANIFILPVVPLAMLFVGLVAVLWWVPFFGALVSVMAYFLLAYIVTLVELFAQVPFASLHNISFPLFLLSVTYALLGFYISKNYPRKNFTQNI